jgi:1-acyl-sn-glycerol-3-phosphate acyltransferase
VQRREKGGFWFNLAVVVVYPLAWLLGRAKYEGRHHIPATGGVLVVANHVSHLDPLYSGVLVYTSRRVPRFLAKHSLWKVPLLGQVLTGSQQIAVYRESADAPQSLRDATRALQEGKVVVIYPEGTITRDPAGWPMLARTGVARLALSADVPVLPAVHWGTREVLDAYNRRFRPLPRKRITVRCGPPVDLSGYRDRAIDGVLLREATDVLMARVRDLLADVRGEQAPTDFYRRGAAS